MTAFGDNGPIDAIVANANTEDCKKSRRSERDLLSCVFGLVLNGSEVTPQPSANVTRKEKNRKPDQRYFEDVM